MPSNKPRALHSGSFLMYCGGTNEGWTLHRLVGATKEHATIVEFDPTVAHATNTVPFTVPSNSLELALPVSYNSLSTGEVIPYALHRSEGSTEFTTVYYHCQVPKGKKLTKEARVTWSSDGTTSVVPLHVQMADERIPAIMQAQAVAQRMIEATVSAFEYRAAHPNEAPPPAAAAKLHSAKLGAKRKRETEPLEQSSFKRFVLPNASSSHSARAHAAPSSVPIASASTLSHAQSAAQIEQAAQQLHAARAAAKRRWWQPLPCFQSQLHAQLDPRLVAPVLPSVRDHPLDSRRDRNDDVLTLARSGGYVDSLHLWHAWDRTKPLPSRHLVVAAYAPLTAFR